MGLGAQSGLVRAARPVSLPVSRARPPIARHTALRPSWARGTTIFPMTARHSLASASGSDEALPCTHFLEIRERSGAAQSRARIDARINRSPAGYPSLRAERESHQGTHPSTSGVSHTIILRRILIRHFDRQLPPDRGPRRNEQIRISPVRLIGPEGEQLGIVPTAQALEKAREAGLDLVEMAADERPPVCKILDYGKMRFLNSQKGNKAGKVRQQKLKEIRVRPRTGDHDVDTKVAQARKFLDHNDKVQVTVLFRGREMQHQQEGRRVLEAVLEKLADAGKVERAPTMDGKKMTALLMPNKAAGRAKSKPKPAADTTAKPST
jgi:translation initiation factor IF-3